MEQEDYPVADLTDTPLQQVRSLEQSLSEEEGKDVILIAYTKPS